MSAPRMTDEEFERLTRWAGEFFELSRSISSAGVAGEMALTLAAEARRARAREERQAEWLRKYGEELTRLRASNEALVEVLLALEDRLISYFCDDDKECEDPDCDAMDWTKPIRAALADAQKAGDNG